MSLWIVVLYIIVYNAFVMSICFVWLVYRTGQMSLWQEYCHLGTGNCGHIPDLQQLHEICRSQNGTCGQFVIKSGLRAWPVCCPSLFAWPAWLVQKFAEDHGDARVLVGPCCPWAVSNSKKRQNSKLSLHQGCFYGMCPQIRTSRIEIWCQTLLLPFLTCM